MAFIRSTPNKWPMKRYYPLKNPKRKSISKRDRQAAFNKTAGRCAYCGAELGPKFHVDHMEPICSNKGTNEIENLWAACKQCNLFKGGFTLDEFRYELSKQVERAQKYSVNFRMALAFGQIQKTENKIEFYFERIGLDGLNPTRNNLQN